jgi:hypothetical protein
MAVEEATEAYYRSLTDDDRAEDAEWAETAAGAAKAVWEETIRRSRQLANARPS